jgi:hypothetical protein
LSVSEMREQRSRVSLTLNPGYKAS